jgi:Acetyltransferase (GNAT) family
MPRLQPPPGCTTARDAANRLGVSEALLSRYVKQGKLKRYGPENRQHKFYKISEVEALLATERYVYMPGAWRNHPNSTFEPATDKDMPTIVDIDTRTFDEPAATADVQLSWLHKNPDTFYVLRNDASTIVGYASLIPLKRDVIDRFIRDELDSSEITSDDILSYVSGEKYHVYIMAIAVDPFLSNEQKHSYGARLVTGLFAFLLNLAEQGIEIETITARSYKPDGLRLLRKMGFPQLRPLTPGKALFAVKVAESGFPWFMQYSDRLAEWKLAHQGTIKGPGADHRKKSTRKKTV